MVSKSYIRLLASLRLKKNRDLHGLFVAEGIKTISELLAEGWQTDLLLVAENFDPNDFYFPTSQPVEFISQREIQQISNLKTPPGILAAFRKPIPQEIIFKGLILALDGLRDPGNMGTIIRLCDWYGIESLICSHDTVDAFNPKVVQASMGSIARLNIFYENFESVAGQADLPLLATGMDGENLYQADIPESCILILGNESNGISKTLSALSSKMLSIPRFGKSHKPESLNVAVSAAIFLAEFRRRSIEK